jgi:hypothetical protein
MQGEAHLGRGMGFPPRVGPDGRVAMSSGTENIRDAIRLVLLTTPGERVMLPGFGAGLNTFLFEPNTPATRRLIEDRIVTALQRWEPRIRLAGVAVTQAPDDPQGAVARITYDLVATGARGEIGVGLKLGVG